MSYRISKEYKDSVGAFFKVPTEIVEDYLNPMTDPQFVLILLWVFCHSRKAVNLDNLRAAFRHAKVDVSDALDFWVKEGILVSDGADAPPAKPQRAETKPVQTAAPTTGDLIPAQPPITPEKPTHEQIRKRAEEDKEIRALFHTAQEMLGRTIGFDMQGILLLLHDGYGLPIEVILMLLDYCVSVGKVSAVYIERLGRNWSEAEIDTIERADERIAALRECNGLWARLARLAGFSNQKPTQAQSKFLLRWSRELHFDIDMIYLAYEEMADHCHKLNFNYINKVLQSWYDAGLKTPQDVERAKKQRSASQTQQPRRTGGQPLGNANAPSYDLEEFKRRSNATPVYEKRKKT